MALTTYRDIACTTAVDVIYGWYTRALLNGWTSTGGSWSNGTTRVANAGPASSSDLSATSSYFIVAHVATGLKMHFQRGSSTDLWYIRVTEGGQTLSGGNATTMDSNASYTKDVYGTGAAGTSWYPTSGTTTTKAHYVFDSATPAFFVGVRRSPFPGGSASTCSHLLLDYVSSPSTWAANPQPWITAAALDPGNNSLSVILTAGSATRGWYKRGISGEAWSTGWYIENPGSVAGSATSEPGGVDTEYEARWVVGNQILGKGALTLYLLQPYRSPIGGMDSGSNFTRAAFGYVTVPNDGSALTS